MTDQPHPARDLPDRPLTIEEVDSLDDRTDRIDVRPGSIQFLGEFEKQRAIELRIDHADRAGSCLLEFDHASRSWRIASHWLAAEPESTNLRALVAAWDGLALDH